jgi:hypothetical protein
MAQRSKTELATGKDSARASDIHHPKTRFHTAMHTIAQRFLEEREMKVLAQNLWAGSVISKIP